MKRMKILAILLADHRVRVARCCLVRRKFSAKSFHLLPHLADGRSRRGNLACWSRTLRSQRAAEILQRVRLLSKWRQQLRRDPERAFQRDREPNDEQVQVSELEQMVGRLTMENALLKKALERLEEQQLPSAASSKTR